MHMHALYAMLLLALAETGSAGPFQVPGVPVTPTSIIGGVIGLLRGVIVAFCTVIFALGALFMITGAGKEDLFQKGKTMMIGSVIGLAVVIGAPTILRMFFGLFG